MDFEKVLIWMFVIGLIGLALTFAWVLATRGWEVKRASAPTCSWPITRQAAARSASQPGRSSRCSFRISCV